MSQVFSPLRPAVLLSLLTVLFGFIGFGTGPKIVLASSSAIPVGTEFLVNTYTTDQQISPAVIDTTNGFVVVWHGEADGGGDDDIRARILDSEGAPVGAHLEVNTTTTGTQAYPDVATHPNGDFLVVWQSQATGSFDILGQRFKSSGALLGAELTLSALTTEDQIRPRIARGDGGNFLLVWQSSDKDFDIGSRLLSSNGLPLGAEATQVNEITTGYQGLPDVAGLSDGRFVVVWQGGETGSGSAEIHGRFLDANGMTVETDMVLVSSTSGDQTTPAVAAGHTGAYFVVTWESDEDSGREIKALGFDSLGMPIGSEVQVSIDSATNGEQSLPDVMIDAKDDAVFIWRDVGEPAPESNQLGSPIYTRSRTCSGPPFSFFQDEPSSFNGDSSDVADLGPDSLAILNDQFQGILVTAPAVAKDSSGGFLAVWQGPDESGTGIRARKALTATIFADGFESEDATLWSLAFPPPP